MSSLIPESPISLNTFKSNIDAFKLLNTVGSISAITSISFSFATFNISLNSFITKSKSLSPTDIKQVKILLNPYLAASLI